MAANLRNSCRYLNHTASVINTDLNKKVRHCEARSNLNAQAISDCCKIASCLYSNDDFSHHINARYSTISNIQRSCFYSNISEYKKFDISTLEEDKMKIRQESHEVYDISRKLLDALVHQLDDTIQPSDKLWIAVSKMIDSITSSLVISAMALV